MTAAPNPDTTDRRTALVVVDVQHDFIAGSLAVTGADRVPDRIRDHLRSCRYDLVVATMDHHTSDTAGHFPAGGDAPDYTETWPHHCMVGTAGAQIDPRVGLPAGTPVVTKGLTTAAYSGFEGAFSHRVGEPVPERSQPAAPTLAALLTDAQITDVVVVGIALDHCVAATARDAAAHGFTVTVLTELTASVAPDTAAAAVAELTALGVRITAPAAR